MGTRVLWDPKYLAVRTTLWWLLWAFANVFGLLRRKARGKGWQLHWAIRAVLTLQAIASSFSLAASLRPNDVQPAEDSVFRGHIFFKNIAEATFLVKPLDVKHTMCKVSCFAGISIWG